MRHGLAGMLALLSLMGGGCGQQTAVDAPEGAEPSSSTTSLPCAETEQTNVMLDISGPGQPTREEAVAAFGGGMTLVAQRGGVVLGLRSDGTVFRVYQVTQREDGWWTEGYRECSG